MSITAVQSSVAQNAIIGVPGDPYDDTPMDIVTKIAAQDTPFGVWVSFKTEGKGTSPAATGDVTGIANGGLVLRDKSLPTTAGYKTGDAMRVMVRGRAFAVAEETVVVTDTPFCRFAAGTGTQLGAFRNDADTATCVALPNARLFKGGGTTSPPVLELTG
jgi:hypothetical protein